MGVFQNPPASTRQLYDFGIPTNLLYRSLHPTVQPLFYLNSTSHEWVLHSPHIDCNCCGSPILRPRLFPAVLLTRSLHLFMGRPLLLPNLRVHFAIPFAYSPPFTSFNFIAHLNILISTWFKPYFTSVGPPRHSLVCISASLVIDMIVFNILYGTAKSKSTFLGGRSLLCAVQNCCRWLMNGFLFKLIVAFFIWNNSWFSKYAFQPYFILIRSFRAPSHIRAHREIRFRL